MIAVDTSVAVAGFAGFGEWHRLNEPARAVLVSADPRASAVYDLMGVEVRRLSDDA